MTDQEKIAFRDKARKDFEGKEINGRVIYQVLIDFDNSGYPFSLRSSDNVNLVDFKYFPLEDYDKILSQCKKPFPRDGFTLNKPYPQWTKEERFTMTYVREYHGLSCYKFEQEPTITLQELKDEAKRIIELL